MRKTILFLIILLFSISFNLYAKAYVVVDKDKIHCIEEKPMEVLTGDMKRYEIDSFPQDAVHYKWNKQTKTIERMTDQEIIEEEYLFNRRINNLEKINAQVKLNAIEELESLYPEENFSEEKEHYKDILESEREVI